MLALANRAAADTRVLDSDYFLPKDFVDRFANEIKGARRVAGPQVKNKRSGDVTDSEDKEAAVRTRNEAGDPTDGLAENVPTEAGDVESDQEARSESDAENTLTAKIREACVTNWKAAAADEKKKMWSIFDECGVFACACRHGFCMWLIDMVRSGELCVFICASSFPTHRVSVPSTPLL